MINRIILSFGSNLGDREKNITNAINMLKDMGVITSIVTSDIVESPALLLDNSPDEWDKDFYNLVLSAKTSLDPIGFFRVIKRVESEFGRKNSPKWSPRIIDIDILFYDDIVLDSTICTIPHKFALDRDFVMKPLLQVAPDYIYPGDGEMNGKDITEIYKIKFTQKEKV